MIRGVQVRKFALCETISERECIRTAELIIVYIGGARVCTNVFELYSLAFRYLAGSGSQDLALSRSLQGLTCIAGKRPQQNP